MSKTIYQPQYENMRKFMESVVNQTTVGKDQTRFGLIFYSTSPMSYFNLKDFDSKRKVRAAIPKEKPLNKHQHGRGLEVLAPVLSC